MKADTARFSLRHALTDVFFIPFCSSVILTFDSCIA
jgi:hypothetical protein